jgi:hypothetical protein
LLGANPDALKSRSLPGPSESLEALDLVLRSENLLYGGALCRVEMRPAFRMNARLFPACDRRSAVLPLLHPAQYVTLCLHRFFGRKALAGLMPLRFKGAELTGTHALVKAGADLTVGDLAHATPERVAKQQPFVDNSLPLEVAIASIAERLLGSLLCPVRPSVELPRQRAEHGAFSSLADHPARLVPIFRGNLQVGR